MNKYRCYLLGLEGRSFGRREFDAKNDIEALEFAHALYDLYAENALNHTGFELWQGSRRVHYQGHRA